MVDKLEKKKCTGCSACYNICPKDCIRMEADEEGFCYPKIDLQECNQCNLCRKVCPAINGFNNKNHHAPQIKAGWSLNTEVRFHSTSGGIFTELSKNILENKGYVVGARYTEEHLVEHDIIANIEEITILRQSKYIQSKIGFTYRRIKELLEKNKKVLFVGTPCQTSGLLNYMRKDYENLLLCDFVCLGCNSPKVYLKYLSMLEHRYDSKVKQVWFKNKTYGWNNFSTKVEFENGSVYLKDRNTDYFMKGYIGPSKLYMRPCCAECNYKTIPRISDITLADFWGIADKDKELDSDQGTSLIMINSKKGEVLFNNSKGNIFSADCELKDAVKGNPAIFIPATMDTRRKDFFKELDEIGFDELMNRYTKESFWRKLKKTIHIKWLRCP